MVVHGTCHPEFAAVERAFAANFASHGELGAAVHVVVDGEPVVDLWGGVTSAGATRPWQPDTLVDVYSVGKPIVAALVLQLVDEGLVGLDDPVSDHWPGFGAGGGEHGTVRQLLCHRLGVPAISRPLTDDDLVDFDVMTRAVAAEPAWWPPGTRHAYHTNTYGHLAGGLLRAVTGTTPGERLRDRIRGPLGADVHFGVADDDLHRCADVTFHGPDAESLRAHLADVDGDERMTLLGYVNPPGYSSFGLVNTRAWRQAQIPSTNGHASARGVAAFYQGVLDDRVLSPELRVEATRVQSSGWCPTLAQDVTFGLGFQPWTPGRPIGRTPGSFGHFGTGGALGFADPVHRVAFGYVMNDVIPRWRSPRNRALVDAVYDSLVRSGRARSVAGGGDVHVVLE